jgi:hypothetical protein
MRLIGYRQLSWLLGFWVPLLELLTAQLRFRYPYRTPDGNIRLASRIDLPASNSALRSKEVEITGLVLFAYFVLPFGVVVAAAIAAFLNDKAAVRDQILDYLELNKASK